MFCKRCGSQLPDNARFCPSCGLDLKGLAQAPVRQEVPPQPVPEAEPKARKFTPPNSGKKSSSGKAAPSGKKFPLKKLLLPATVVLLAVVSAVLFLRGGKVYQLPDPAVFFGQEARDVEEKEDHVLYSFFFEEDPAPMLEDYENLLNSEEYDLFMMKNTGDETGHEYLLSSSKFLFMGHTTRSWSSRDALLLDDWLLDGGQHVVEISLYNPDHLQFAPQGRYSGSPDPVNPADPGVVLAETPPAEEPPAPAADLSGPTLPDIDSFSGNALELIKETVFLNHTKRSYSIHYNEKFVQEYVALLENYGFTLKDTVENDTRSIYYLFDYAGPGSVETFHPDVKKIKDEEVAVYIWDNRGYEIQIYFGDGITYADTGDRTTQALTPYESSGASGGSSSIDWGDSSSGGSSVPKIKCTKCFGDGEVDCMECGGDGNLANYGSTPNYSGSGRTSYTDYRDCPNCVDGKVECPRCHGTGWQ